MVKTIDSFDFLVLDGNASSVKSVCLVNERYVTKLFGRGYPNFSYTCMFMIINCYLLCI